MEIIGFKITLALKMMRINGDRLWQRLMDMAQIGATPKGGVNRVALSDEEKAGRELFIQWCKAAGCTVEIDQIGNIFARRAGSNPELPAILMGSHLDSQPTGGKFDGTYGVLAGLEVIETLNDHQISTQHPIEVVSWTNEEGARFAPGLTGSAVFIGRMSLEEAYATPDKKGILLGNELERIEQKGSIQVGNRAYKASFEVHIEQGPILEQKKLNIGVVTDVQGTRWYDILIHGKETHAGTTPMDIRIDPVKASINILQGLYEIGDRYAPHARVTVGYLDASPGVKNTVPGLLKVSLDMRVPNSDTLQSMHEDLLSIVASNNANSPAKAELVEIMHSPPVAFDSHCISAVEKASQQLGFSYQKMISGAGHDAALIAKVAPTSMIFIPCKDGLSHNELESATPIDVANGADVLLHAILEMDKKE